MSVAGSLGRLDTDTAPPAWSGDPKVVMMLSCFALVAAPEGNGKDAALTGCVARQNVPVTANVPASFVLTALNVVSVAAPDGNGNAVALTGCVAG